MIHIVSTAVKSGKGGISTALIGFCESDILNASGINIIESHNENRSRADSFKDAARRIKSDVKRGDIVWLHCARWVSMLRKYILARLAKRQGAKVFIQFHSSVTADYTNSIVGRFLLKRLYHSTDGICVLSEWWRRLLVSKLHFDPARIHIVPNPLDKRFEQLALTDSYKKPDPERINLISMTRLVEGKNVGAVIDTMKKLPQNYYLTIAGDGPLREKLENQAADLNLSDRVSFAGWVDYDKKIELLKQQDLFVLPSQFDAFGMGYLEAMAAGLPVVALRVGATEDVVPHEEAGLLVEQCDADELANAIKEIMSSHHAFSLRTKEYVAKNYPADTILPSLLKFFGAHREPKPSYLSALKTQMKGFVEPLQRIQHRGDVPVVYYNAVPNVGDALNPYLIHQLTSKSCFRLPVGRGPHILGIGSILHIATPSSIVWGSGLIDPNRHPGSETIRKMTIAAVRGRYTQGRLKELGAALDEVALGDPAVLLPDYFQPQPSTSSFRLGVVPHYVDQGNALLAQLKHRDDIKLIDVMQPPENFINDLASCDFIFSTSLHGLILADAYGIPNKWIRLSDQVAGGDFKFLDYYSTTDHTQPEALRIQSAAELMAAIDDVAELCRVSPFQYDKKRLLDAFPSQLVPR